MNYRRALWFARMVGQCSLGLGVISCILMLAMSLMLFCASGSVGAAATLPSAFMGLIGAAFYLLLGGFGYAVCAALHHYLFQALGAVDDESPGLNRDTKRRP